MSGAWGPPPDHHDTAESSGARHHPVPAAIDPAPAGRVLFVGARQVVTCAGPARARRGDEMADLGIRTDVAVAVDGGRIAAVGPVGELGRRFPDAAEVDCGGGVLLPGLVDSHTHAVFGRPRYEEHELRATGVPYMEIARRGGGIHASVRDLRSRSDDELVALALPRLRRMASHGVTTVEVKSGYGLSLHDELRTLDVVRRLQALTPLRLVPTWLGAHEIPAEFRETAVARQGYMRLLREEMLPAVVAQGVARYADVFCEPGVFSVEESRDLLSAAGQAGLGLKLHADELETSGGAELAASLEAVSADHLAAVSAEGIRRLAASRTVATLLPGTMLFLGRAPAPARALVAAGAAVALATDFNPGTSPTTNLPLILTLGVSVLRLSVAEAVTAATVNAAAALDLAGETGQIAPGFSADLALFDADDVRELPYWYGERLCRASWACGQPCHRP